VAEGPPSPFAQAVEELRRMWREFVGGLRVTGRATVGEARVILTELDAPKKERPGRVRRAWRGFRRAPVLVQGLIGLALFGLWAWFLFAVYA
jgi:hypothetical protein